MTTSTAGATTGADLSRLWRRELHHYPATPQRVVNLGIVVLVTVQSYYQFYVAGSVGTDIIQHFHMSFLYYVNLNVVGLLLGGLASGTTGFTDRYGRANTVTVGVLLTAGLCLFGVPNAHTKLEFAVCVALLGIIEGVILVATPALIRDFSPQIGRGAAMGFWAIGPVLGSLVATAVVTRTIDHVGRWQDEYTIAGFSGLAVFGLSLFWLRELSANLRDQLMVSERDRVLVEARAKGIDVEAGLRHPIRQMLRPDIILSSIAISLLLIVYYIQVFFFPIFLQLVFGYSTSRANSLANWMWAAEAVALVAFGVASDKLRVRKPFMLAGAVGAALFTLAFISKVTHAGTSFTTLAFLAAGISACFGIAYPAWMAGFTETVEKHNPALTATGLSVFGAVIRFTAAALLFVAPTMVSSVTTLIDHGPAVQAAVAGKDPSLTATQNATVAAVAADPTIVAKVQGVAAKYPAELATAQKLSQATQAALAKSPGDPAAQLGAAADVSGVPVADVQVIATLAAQHPQALAAAATVDPATAAALIANPKDQQAAAKAVGEVASGLKVTPASALALLTELSAIPAAQVKVVAEDGAKVKAAGDALKALAAVPTADLAFVGKWGPALQDPVTQHALKTLQVEGPKVQKAAKESPKQWQHYFLLGVGGALLFIPMIFLMAGSWDPRRARREQQQHDAWVEAELAKLDAESVRA